MIMFVDANMKRTEGLITSHHARNVDVRLNVVQPCHRIFKYTSWKLVRGVTNGRVWNRVFVLVDW